MVTRRGFLFVGFFFCSSSGTLRSKTTNVMAIVPKSNLFTIWSLYPKPMHRTATAHIVVGTTFHVWRPGDGATWK